MVAVVLLVLYIVRAALVVGLVCAAPLMLLAHALPQADGFARLWWRGMLAALGVQVAQALVPTALISSAFAEATDSSAFAEATDLEALVEPGRVSRRP